MYAYVSLYDHEVGSASAHPNSTILEVSSGVSIASLGGTVDEVTFSFSGNTQLSANSAYAFTVMLSAVGHYDASSFVQFKEAHSGSGSTSYMYNLGDWSSFAGGQGPLRVYGQSEPETAPTATPTPTLPASFSPVPTYSPTILPTWSIPPINDGTIDDFTAAVVNVLVPIIFLVFPAFLLGVFLRGGKWGFMIGMMIGASLGFIFFANYVPLWLVFAVFVGIAAMAWGSR